MNCKNCKENIVDQKNYCSNCGAKIVLDRVTTKNLWSNFTIDVLGWDNKYLTTLKLLITKPEVVLNGYITGTRKKFVAPFVFLAIGTAIAMLVFNKFSDKYIQLTNSLYDQQVEIIQERLGNDESIESFEDQKMTLKEDNIETQKSVLEYLNIFTFILIPFYSLISFFVFGKPHNYGEHLIINCYLQGVTFIISVLFFLVSIFTSPVVYFYALAATVGYYLYAYKRLNGYTFGTTLIKFLKFCGIILTLPILIYVVGFLIGFLNAKFG